MNIEQLFSILSFNPVLERNGTATSALHGSSESMSMTNDSFAALLEQLPAQPDPWEQSDAAQSSTTVPLALNETLQGLPEARESAPGIVTRETVPIVDRMSEALTAREAEIEDQEPTDPVMPVALPTPGPRPETVGDRANAVIERDIPAPPTAASPSTSPVAFANAPDTDSKPVGSRSTSVKPVSGGEAMQNTLPPAQATVTAADSPSVTQTSGPQSSGPQITPSSSVALLTPVSSHAWGQELGQHVARMFRHGDQKVSLQLNPQDLGPLTIELKVSDQQAQLHLFSNHAQVRGALEQNIPQLREVLAEQGISLGEASVGEEDRGRQESNSSGSAARTVAPESHEQVSSAGGTAHEAEPLPVKSGVNLYV